MSVTCLNCGNTSPDGTRICPACNKEIPEVDGQSGDQASQSYGSADGGQTTQSYGSADGGQTTQSYGSADGGQPSQTYGGSDGYQTNQNYGAAGGPQGGYHQNYNQSYSQQPQYPGQLITPGMATASLVMGILALVCFGIVFGILAIVFAQKALREYNPQIHQGRGLAVAGRVMGIIGLAGWGIYLIIIIATGSFYGMTQLW